jgi:hypothetical protein
MNRQFSLPALILAAGLLLGLASLGSLLGEAAIQFKEYERTVTVKGLSEREVPADVVIWPIVFTEANNDLEALYQAIDASKQRIQAYLVSQGIESAEISHSLPAITDKSAQQYGGGPRAEFRYVGVQTVTVYSERVALVRAAMGSLGELGKSGIAFTGQGHQGQIEYLFTGLNDIKPAMIQEATAKAREVATKFAQDSNSTLGKIKRASQGQFSIQSRDNNNPHLKKVRVVSTVEYYLSD